MLSLFALHESNRFVHVSEVERGLACDCRCAVCGEPVIARQGELREHHFAHSSNAEPCASYYESDLHRFAKRVIIEARGLVVPVTPAASQALGFGERLDPSIRKRPANPGLPRPVIRRRRVSSGAARARRCGWPCAWAAA
jgi:competence protein CoiA